MKFPNDIVERCGLIVILVTVVFIAFLLLT